jgi:hypothetical protein
MNYWNILIILVVVLAIYFVCSKYKTSIKEAFGMEDDARVVRYGDVITMWSPAVNKFLQADPTQGNRMNKIPLGKMNLSHSLLGSEDIPSSMEWVQYMIVDGRDPGDLGNTAPVKYGAPIFLKTVHLQNNTFLPTYVTAWDNNNVYMTTNRLSWETLTLESARGLQDSEVHYGDMLLLKTWKKDMSYIHVSRTTDVVLSNSNAITRNFYIYDRFGQGLNVDWARRGTTAQSSTNNNLFSQFAIDGNMLTFSSTNKEQKPWWEVSLPKDVIISRIVISNVNDPNQSQLSNFEVKLYDFDDSVVDTKAFDSKGQPKYSWENVNQIARKVRIMLNKQDNLNIADVRVYGQGVNYSVLLNEEMSKNLLANETFTADSAISFRHRTLPRVSKDMTIMFLLQLDKLPSEVSNVLVKSRNVDENRTPNILVHPPEIDGQYSKLQYLVTTDAGNNEMGENFMINYNVMRDRKFHLTAVHDAGINKGNGWLPCKFSKSTKYSGANYLCNFMTRELYTIDMASSKQYKDEQVIELDDPESYGFTMKGLYEDKMSIANVKIYINGVLNTTYQLKGNVKQNQHSLNIGAFGKYKGFEGTMSFLKFSNRVIPQEYIHRESQILTSRLSVQLMSAIKKVSSDKTILMEPSFLPEIDGNKPEYSIMFWLNSQRPVAGTGGEESVFVYGDEGLYFNKDSNKLFSKSSDGQTGVTSGEVVIHPDQWMHIAYVVKDSLLTLYVNGKMVGSKSLSKKDIKRNSFYPMKFGGFSGFVTEVYFSNYGLGEMDIKNKLVFGPVSVVTDKVRSTFNSVGCTSDPIDFTSTDPDAYTSKWITMGIYHKDAELTTSMSEFKKQADEGIDSEDIVKLKLAEKCYGRADTANRVELNKSKKLLGLKEAKECPKSPQQTVNDFDIKTHKDFNNYVEKALVRSPPPMVPTVTRLPPDPTKYVSTEYLKSNYLEKSKVENSDGFMKMRKQIEDLNKQLVEMNKMKELVAKCQANTNKVEILDKSIGARRAMAKMDTTNPKLMGELKQLEAQRSEAVKCVRKDTKRLVDSQKLAELVNKQAQAENDYEFLHAKKKNIELAKLRKRMTPQMESLFDNSNRLEPGGMTMGATKVSIGSGAGKESVDLGKIEKMIHDDFSELEKKIDLITAKLNGKKNMSNVEVAKLNNRLATIKKNSVMKK